MAGAGIQAALKQREALLSAKETRAARLSSLASPATPQPAMDTPSGHYCYYYNKYYCHYNYYHCYNYHQD